MTWLSLAHLSASSMALGFALHLLSGFLLGLLYFQCVWWNARWLASGGRVSTTVILAVGRFALLGLCLAVASLEGALPLLAMALGVLIARPMVMRGVRETAP